MPKIFPYVIVEREAAPISSRYSSSKEDAPDAAAVLEKYREGRYNDFLGYAPFEAEKIENGRVLTYGRYVILIVLPDTDSALSAADKAFKA